MRCLVAMAAGLLPAAAFAAPPAVVADITPVHSLVARVMDGVGEPALILPPGASPHGYAMRPSEARALERADVVFWLGEGLTPWLARSIGSLADDAVSVELLEAEGVELLDTREEAAFGHEGGDDHDDDHGHGLHDPHAWLDPENGKAWLDVIASTLAAADPANAAAYEANAAAGRDGIDAAEARIEARIAPVRGKPFVVLHDAFHYFERRFDIEAAGALSVSDASDPGPGRVAELRDVIASLGVVCVFAEPQFAGRPIGMLTEGAEVRTGILDPLGTGIEPGPALYSGVLEGIADGLAGCLE